MLYKLDESVGKVVEALQRTHMLQVEGLSGSSYNYSSKSSSQSIISFRKKANDDHQDSIIVFTTDNGGPAAGFDLNHASNWPLKGVRPDHVTMGNKFFSEERKSKKSERRSRTHYGKEE